MTDESQREKVFKTGEKLARKNGLIALTRMEVCSEAGIPPGSFKHIMGTGFPEFVLVLRARGVDSKRKGLNVKLSRANPQLRCDQILGCAVSLAADIGYLKLSTRNVAEAAGVSDSLVLKYFGSFEALRDAVVRQAVQEKALPIIAQAVVNRHPGASDVPVALARRAFKYYT